MGSLGSGEIPQMPSCSKCLYMSWLFSILHVLECLYFNKPLPLHTSRWVFSLTLHGVVLGGGESLQNR